MASSSSDQFFEEEEGLARRQASASSETSNAKSKAKAKVKGAPQKVAGTHRPPSFGLVVAIAVVALLLGVGIGYFAAMAVVDRSDGAVASPAGGVNASTAPGTDAEEGSLPSGHPDIASMMNPDGSVNQEALEAYKASRASGESGEDTPQTKDN